MLLYFLITCTYYKCPHRDVHFCLSKHVHFRSKHALLFMWVNNYNLTWRPLLAWFGSQKPATIRAGWPNKAIMLAPPSKVVICRGNQKCPRLNERFCTYLQAHLQRLHVKLQHSVFAIELLCIFHYKTQSKNENSYSTIRRFSSVIKAQFLNFNARNWTFFYIYWQYKIILK